MHTRDYVSGGYLIPESDRNAKCQWAWLVTGRFAFMRSKPRLVTVLIIGWKPQHLRISYTTPAHLVGGCGLNQPATYDVAMALVNLKKRPYPGATYHLR